MLDIVHGGKTRGRQAGSLLLRCVLQTSSTKYILPLYKIMVFHVSSSTVTSEMGRELSQSEHSERLRGTSTTVSSSTEALKATRGGRFTEQSDDKTKIFAFVRLVYYCPTDQDQ